MNVQILQTSCSETPSGQVGHFHDCHQIIYIAEGSAYVCVGNDRSLANAGSLVLVSRYERHAIEVVSPVYKRYTLEISHDMQNVSGEDYSLLSVLVNRAAGFRHVVDMGPCSEDAERILLKMMQESASDLPMRGEMLGTLLKLLLLLVYRLAPEVYTVNCSTDAVDVVRKIQRRFEQFYQEPYVLQDLAQEYHISSSHLSHLYKQVTGYSPMAYLRACRVSAAKRYLAESNMSIKEVVHRCGFSDESNFCRIFRQDAGLTPTRFRNQYKR